ncbi:MAG: nitroreductase family protein [bacterium]
MDAIDTILARRSIRKYTSQPVPDELVESLLKAAMSAPSAHNSQPWHFVVIKDRSILNEITTFHKYAQMLKEAPLAIAVCGEPGLEKAKGRWPSDCAAATQNILLAGHAKGLGTCWIGIYPDEEREANLRKLLQMPDTIVPFSLVAVGYPGEQKPPANRYNPARIHYDRW